MSAVPPIQRRWLRRETVGRIPGGLRSRSIPTRPPGAKPLRDNPTLSGATMRVSHSAVVPGAGWDAPGFFGTCDRPRARRPESRGVVAHKAAKSARCRARSRRAAELLLGGFAEESLPPPGFRFSFVQERAQGGAQTRIVEDALPGGVAIQLGQQRRKLGHELPPLAGGEFEDCSFDFLHRAHPESIPLGTRRIKFGTVFPTDPSALGPVARRPRCAATPRGIRK